MSVFTPVSLEVLASWLARYAVGRAVALQGIEAGVQNSNFFLTTTLGRYVLTLFEAMPRAELPFYLHLMAHLARHGLSDGRRQTNPRGAAWRTAIAQDLLPHLPPDERSLLQAELAFQQRVDLAALPQGVIHADLFRDNVLWDGEHIGGVIDFYFAGVDALLFNVAVTANDWCVAADGHLDAGRTTALLAAYHAERPFTDTERAAWPAVLRAAALRFWLSRAADFHLPRPGEMVLVKDPNHYRDLLRLRIAAAADLPPLP